VSLLTAGRGRCQSLQWGAMSQWHYKPTGISSPQRAGHDLGQSSVRTGCGHGRADAHHL
jgi:hypothetical protein